VLFKTHMTGLNKSILMLSVIRLSQSTDAAITLTPCQIHHYINIFFSANSSDLCLFTDYVARHLSNHHIKACFFHCEYRNNQLTFAFQLTRCQWPPTFIDTCIGIFWGGRRFSKNLKTILAILYDVHQS